MNIDRRHMLAGAIALTAGASAPLLASPRRIIPAPAPQNLLPAEYRKADLPPMVAEALESLERHGRRVVHRDRIGVVDFTKNSGERRFQIVGGETVDFTEANLDLAVRLVDGPGDLEGVQLAPAQRVVVAAEGAPDEWIAWPGAPLPEGAEPEVQAGDAGQALASAIAGLGKAMLPLLLCDEAIEAKQLTVLEGPEEGRRAYWLVAPRPQWRQKKVKALVAFLTGGAAA